MHDLPDHVRRNRLAWDQKAQEYAPAGAQAWAQDTPTWGIWGVPEAEVGMLPADLTGKDAIELGCGTAYVSAWLARRGARVVGIDNSAAQLATARELQRQHGLDFPLLHGNAEAVPYPDASFDFAISEYGACLWADPQRWVPEAARLLRPGGQLVFLINSFLLLLCSPNEADAPATAALQRPAFDIYRVEWPGDDGIAKQYLPERNVNGQCDSHSSPSFHPDTRTTNCVSRACLWADRYTSATDQSRRFRYISRLDERWPLYSAHLSRAQTYTRRD